MSKNIKTVDRLNLIPRLYRINFSWSVIDKYDLPKTELYSDCQQIGKVLQYTLWLGFRL